MWRMNLKRKSKIKKYNKENALLIRTKITATHKNALSSNYITTNLPIKIKSNE